MVVRHAAELTGEYLDRLRELGKLRARLLGIQNLTRPQTVEPGKRRDTTEPPGVRVLFTVFRPRTARPAAANSRTEAAKRAVTAYREALQERTREQVPLDWAMTQYNLGNALGALGERERRTARLEEAATAFDACLTVMDTTAEWVPRARLRRDEIRAEVARREATK